MEKNNQLPSELTKEEKQLLKAMVYDVSKQVNERISSYKESAKMP